MSATTTLGSLALLLATLAVPAQAKVAVVTTTPSLADIAKRIGGQQVTVHSLMRGNENPHNVVPKPSFVMKLRSADLFVHTGLDAEPWVSTLLRSARKHELLPGGDANIDASTGIDLLEIPQNNELTRAMGDIHVYGNPHYLLDPLNGVRVGYTLSSRFADFDPTHAHEYATRAKEMDSELTHQTAVLLKRVQSLALCPVVTYHRTWSYFLKRFDITKLGEIEPKPGIASGPRHIAALSREMRRSASRLVISTSYEDRRIASRLAESVGGKHLVLAQDVEALPGVDRYRVLFETNIGILETAVAIDPPVTKGCQ